MLAAGVPLLLLSTALLARQSPKKAASSQTPVVFQNVAAASGVAFSHTNGASSEKHIVETMGSGGLLFDYDGDGWLDVFLVDGGSLVDATVAGQARSRLFHNRGNGTFDDVTQSAKIEHFGYGMGACAADYDNDGHQDLFLTNFGPNVLYHNHGDGTFTNVTQAAGVGSSLLSTSCAFADIDNDGWLDLFVTNYVDPEGNKKVCGDSRTRAYCRPDVYKGAPNLLYRNNGDGTFTDVTRSSGVYRTDGKGLGVVFGDYDNDGRADFFVANDLVPNFLYHNEGRGSFREVGLLAGVAVASDGRPRAGMGTDFGDYDGDGQLDLVVTNFEMENHNLYRNLGRGLFADATLPSGVGAATLRFLGFGAVFLDYDNDGSLDLAIANGHVLDNTSHFQSASKYAQRKLLLRNDGHGRFTDLAAEAGPGFSLEKVGRTLVAGDIDNDGDLDLLVTNNGQPADLLRNDGGNRGHAVLVRLIGRTSNRDGIGARLRAAVGPQIQTREIKAGSSYLGQNDLRAHFGIGQAKAIDRLEVRWPSGHVDVVEHLDADAIITLTEGGGLRRTPLAR
ncbi:MAG: CRTAC1 family protein [Acidobacteriota bacterium]